MYEMYYSFVNMVFIESLCYELTNREVIMIIGVPTEIKAFENRVALTPAGAYEMTSNGHEVYIQQGAGLGSGFEDEEYVEVGAKILSSAKEVFDTAEMIMKVKEPLAAEYNLFHENQVLFTYLHLAPDAPQTEALLKSKIVGIAYETVTLPDGSLPLLTPMSEVAGRMSVQVGARLLEKINDGRGVLLGGVAGVERANVVVIGGGVVGTSAAKMAMGLGANVAILDVSIKRLTYFDDIFGNKITTLMSNPFNIAQSLKNADLVIGAVLIPGAKAPRLVTEEMVMNMKKGSVIVDVAIDQGGSVETIDRITTHDNPYFVKHGVVHYSVANMPGAVPRASTMALTNATLPYAIRIANKGAEKAMKDDRALLEGLNVYKGALTRPEVAEAHNIAYTDPTTLF